MEDPKNIAILIIVGSFAFCSLVAVFVVFIVRYQKRIYENENKLESLKLQQQLAVFNASAAAEEKEKERIARNLHDEINPLLTVLKQNIQKHRLYIMKNKFEIESFNNDFELIDKAMEGIRHCSDDLVPSFLVNYGLITSLKDYIRSLNDAEIVSASFMNDSNFQSDVPFSKHQQLNIYRACLEILNNTIKHAACKSLSLHIRRHENTFLVEFKHNGKGLDMADVEQFALNNEGTGLKSLKARTLLLGATINFEKGSQSSTVVLKIPFKNE